MSQTHEATWGSLCPRACDPPGGQSGRNVVEGEHERASHPQPVIVDTRDAGVCRLPVHCPRECPPARVRRCITGVPIRSGCTGSGGDRLTPSDAYHTEDLCQPPPPANLVPPKCSTPLALLSCQN